MSSRKCDDIRHPSLPWQLFMFINSLWTAHREHNKLCCQVTFFFENQKCFNYKEKKNIPANDASLFVFFPPHGNTVDMFQITIHQQFKTIIHSEMSFIEVLSNKHFT